MKKKQSEIFDALNKLSIFMGQKQSTERLTVFAEMLSSFGTEEVRNALRVHAMTSKFFPQLSEVVDHLQVKKIQDDPEIISSLILRSISEFGTYNPQGARDSLGESAWEVVSIFGGWQSLCSITNDQVQVVRAQLRELARAVIRKKEKELLRPPEVDGQVLQFAKQTIPQEGQ